MHGDVTMALRAMFRSSGTSRSPAFPRATSLHGEELNYPFLFEELDRSGYEGFVGCEYNPRAGTLEGLGLVRALRVAPKTGIFRGRS